MDNQQLERYFGRFLKKSDTITYRLKHEPSLYNKRPWYVYVVCVNRGPFPGQGAKPSWVQTERLLTACASEKNARAYARKTLRQLAATVGCKTQEPEGART
jgi:hypothetical protein